MRISNMRQIMKILNLGGAGGRKNHKKNSNKAGSDFYVIYPY